LAAPGIFCAFGDATGVTILIEGSGKFERDEPSASDRFFKYLKKEEAHPLPGKAHTGRRHRSSKEWS
jgi:hypothetical protein